MPWGSRPETKRAAFTAVTAQFAKLVDYMLVMDYLLANVNRRTIEVQGDLHYVNGAHNARTKAAGLQQIDLLVVARVRGDRL